MADDTFQNLIQRVRDGDSDAVSTLLGDYGAAIRREVRFCLLDQQLKRVVGESDIYQSVVSRFVLGLRAGNFEFESTKDVVNLLKVIVRARVAQHARFWRSQRRNLRRNRDLICAHVLNDGQPDVGQTVSDAELLTMALQIMPERDRKILDWRQNGLEWLQIAHRLNCPSAESVRKSHKRALHRIARQILHDSGPGKTVGADVR